MQSATGVGHRSGGLIDAARREGPDGGRGSSVRTQGSLSHLPQQLTDETDGMVCPRNFKIRERCWAGRLLDPQLGKEGQFPGSRGNWSWSLYSRYNARYMTKPERSLCSGRAIEAKRRLASSSLQADLLHASGTAGQGGSFWLETAPMCTSYMYVPHTWRATRWWWS